MASDASSNGIGNLGEYLRGKRVGQKISLDDLCAQTRISPRFIEAIEGNRFEQLPNAVSARGFLRAYARALALAEEPILRRYAELTGDASGEGTAPGSGEGSGKPVIRAAPTEPVSTPMKMGIPLVLIASAVLLVWVVSREKGGNPLPGATDAPRPATSVSPAPVTPVPESIPAVPAPSTPPDMNPFPSAPREAPSGPMRPEINPLQEATTVRPPLPAPSTVPGHPPTSFPELPPAQAPSIPPLSADSAVPVFPAPNSAVAPSELKNPLVLEIEAMEPSWLEVTIDDAPVREALLQPGEKVRWKARDRFLLTLGNAGGVKVSFNGKPLEPFGPAGKVVKGILLVR